MSNHRYDNIILDIVESGILRVLTPRQGEILLAVSGYARTDSQSSSHRTFYLYQRKMAEHFGMSRARMCNYLRDLEGMGLIIQLPDKHKPTVSGKGTQPANRYAVSDYTRLCDIASAHKRKAAKMDPETAKGLREGVHRTEHLNGHKGVHSTEHLGVHSTEHPSPKGVHSTEHKKVVDLKEVKGSRKGMDNGLRPSFAKRENGNGHVNGKSRPRPNVPTPQRFFNGVEPTELNSDTYRQLNDLRLSPLWEEAEWAEWMMWELRYGQTADVEAIPLTFN